MYKFEKLNAHICTHFVHIYVKCITASDIKTEGVDYGV